MVWFKHEQGNYKERRIKMAKQYKNVSEMMNNLKTSQKVKNKVERDVKGKILSQYLFKLRCANNMTQQSIAKKLKCSQGRISKIESSFDKNLKIEDLIFYANACNLVLEIGFSGKQ